MQFRMECESIAVHDRQADGRIATCAFTVAFILILIILYWIRITTLSHSHKHSTWIVHTVSINLHIDISNVVFVVDDEKTKCTKKTATNAIYGVLSVNFFSSILNSNLHSSLSKATHTHTHTRRKERHVRLTHVWNIQNSFAAGNCTLHRNARIHLSAT